MWLICCLKTLGTTLISFFHSGAWAQKHVRAESTYQWSEDDPAITWPMFIWDENDCLRHSLPKIVME